MAKDDRGEYEEDVCTCCRVHTTWRERPLPKHEVTIEEIAELNRLYSKIYNEFHDYLQNEHGDRNYKHKNNKENETNSSSELSKRIKSLETVITEYGIYRSLKKMGVTT